MFETSTNTEKLDAALAKIQGEIKPAIKDSQNPHFRSSYADIAAVWDAIRPALAKYGVNVTQWPIESEDKSQLKIVTRIAISGEWMKATWCLPVSKPDAHGFGSAVTYARRFTLMAALGVAPEDDDANHASSRSTQAPPTQPTRPQSVPNPTAAKPQPTVPRQGNLNPEGW